MESHEIVVLSWPSGDSSVTVSWNFRGDSNHDRNCHEGVVISTLDGSFMTTVCSTKKADGHGFMELPRGFHGTATALAWHCHRTAMNYHMG